MEKIVFLEHETLRARLRRPSFEHTMHYYMEANHGGLMELLKDATAHAEMLAITQAEEALGDWRLTDCTLYVTKEPCPMCAGAIVHVRLARVVFGARDPKAGSAGSALNLLQFPTLNHRCEITPGVREPECRMLLQNFFLEQRRKAATGGDGDEQLN